MMSTTTTSSFFSAAFDDLAKRVRMARARRAQRIALITLMDMDASRLDDLGLSVGDIVDALQSPVPPAPVLEAHRARNAHTWTVGAAAR